MKSPEWKVKAEQFLENHLDNDDHNAEDAASYLLSRGMNNDHISKIIDKAITRWKNDSTNWAEKSLSNHYRATSVLKLMQWAEIEPLKKYQNSICDKLCMPSNHDFLTGQYSPTAIFYPYFFPLFTSDIAVDKMNSKLSSLVHIWQNHLIDICMKKEIFLRSLTDDNIYSQSGALLLSANIFASKRIKGFSVNEELFDKAVQYLIDNQNDSGTWGYNSGMPDSEEEELVCLSPYEEQVNSEKHVALTAVCMYALYSAQAYSSSHAMQKAKDCLIRQQQSDGGWYQLCNAKYGNSVQTTILVLDAIEMVSDGDLTFEPNFETSPDNTETPKFLLTSIGKISIDVDTQTVYFDNKKVTISGGGANWKTFKLLFEAGGEIVTYRKIMKITGRDECNKIRYDLCRALCNKDAGDLANLIKTESSVGLYLDTSTNNGSNTLPN